MKLRMSVVWGAALLGLLVGAGWAVHDWTPDWPRLSRLALYRGCALGWLIGLAAGIILACLLSRRRTSRASLPMSRDRRAAHLLVMFVAIAPVGLWATTAFPHSTLQTALASGRRPGDSRPNLILITIDALRYDRLGVDGNRQGLTPTLDAVAAEGTVYESAYAVSPWTLSSLGSVFTLLPPSRSGTKVPPGETELWYWQGAMLAADVPLLSERLRDAGYVTAAELTNPFLANGRGWGRGFEFFDHAPLPEGMAPDMTRGAQVTKPALDWADHNRREPFFLWLHYLDPHAPYDAPTTPRALRNRHAMWRAGERNVWEARKKTAGAKERAEYQDFCRAMYAEEVRYADRCVGDLVRGLKAQGLWDRSLVVITADHGEELFDHGGIDHGHTMHGELLHVPLIVKWPRGVTADRRIPQTVPLPAVGATFMESAQVKLSTGAYPPLPRRRAARGSAVYSEAALYGPEQTALTTDQWRVIYHPDRKPPRKQFEVYDRRQDPEEQHDLGATTAAAGLRDLLRRMTDRARYDSIHNHNPEAPTLTPDAERQLRSLGYMK